MPKKSHHISNVINIKIDTTKKTKKRKSKRKKHSHVVVPHSIAGYSSITPYPLTNKPYYMETNSLLLNPQLQLQDVPKPTTHEAFNPPPAPSALTNDTYDDQGDNLSQISNNDLSFSKLYAGPPENFQDHIPPPTGTLKNQYVGAGGVNMMKSDYQHQMNLANRRANYASDPKVVEKRQQRAENKLMATEDTKPKPKPQPKAKKPKKEKIRGLDFLLKTP